MPMQSLLMKYKKVDIQMSALFDLYRIPDSTCVQNKHLLYQEQ